MNENARSERSAFGKGSVDGAAFENPMPDWDRYELVERIGEGATGTVYRAVDRRLERTVAVKMLRGGTPSEIRRLQSEAKAQAGIDHEHICRVFEVGEIGGHAFLAMQFIRGEVLRSLIPDLDLEQKVDVTLQVARAVQAAHMGGVTHRDLNPGNIMVESRPNGSLHAYVLDFGMAGSRTKLRELGGGSPIGAPSFLAPEQFGNDPAAVDHRADVYGLGSTLYGVLAEQAPFFGATRSEIERKTLEEEPLSLGVVVPGTPHDLETVVAVAMAKSADHRYPSARAFADDLVRWKNGEPIVARAPTPFYRVLTWVRARRTVAALLALVLTVFGVVTVSVVWHRYREATGRNLAQQYQSEVEQMDRLLRRSRMMPLHDTTAAEERARNRLVEIEESLLDKGSLARGPAYFALGTGYLLLREHETAEFWLRAALENGFDTPAAESALGIVLATRSLASRTDGILDGDRRKMEGARSPVDQRESEEVLRLLGRRGPATDDRDLFHQALSLAVEGRAEEAISTARESLARAPWLYEAHHLEADILLGRSISRQASGDVAGAIGDLESAGDAFRRALDVARSDAWLFEDESRRLLRLAGLSAERGDLDADLVDQAIERAAAADVARPRRVTPLMLAARAYCLKAELARMNGGDPRPALVEALHQASSAVEIEPQNRDLVDLRDDIRLLLSESGGGGSG